LCRGQLARHHVARVVHRLAWLKEAAVRRRHDSVRRFWPTTRAWLPQMGILAALTLRPYPPPASLNRPKWFARGMFEYCITGCKPTSRSRVGGTPRATPISYRRGTSDCLRPVGDRLCGSGEWSGGAAVQCGGSGRVSLQSYKLSCSELRGPCMVVVPRRGWSAVVRRMCMSSISWARDE
jgi:hypothetical protein